MNTTPPIAFRRAAELEALQGRFALRITARLDEQADALPHDLSERLRFARDRALAQARSAHAAALSLGVSAQGGHSAAAVLGGRDAGGPRSGWWLKLAGLVPLLALVGGLVLIQQANSRAQIDAAAEIDSALLSDDLPPDAYSDPGFGEFLKTSHE